MSLSAMGSITRRLKNEIDRHRRFRTFDRGIDLPDHKHHTADKPVQRLACPASVAIPLRQHTGKTVESVVTVDDQVEIGTRIGDLNDRWSVPVHASVAGKVTAIDLRPFGDGTSVPCVVIKADPTQPCPSWPQRLDWQQMDSRAILQIIRDGGIVGMAGAGFPTHINLDVRQKTPTLIINGAECEPFLTGDYRTMLEHPDAVIGGALIQAKLIGADRIFIGIEANKPDAIELLQQKTAGLPQFAIVTLAVKYPQGYKKTLLRAITGREPPLGGRSADVGCIVRNVSTTVAIFEAVVYGKPLFERVVTVTGPKAFAGAGNYLVPLGTSVRHVLETIGVCSEELDGFKIVRGGPMTGLALDTLDAPIVKPSTGILVIPPSMIQTVGANINPCIRCAACVAHCPMGLYPNEISQLVEAGTPQAAQRLHIQECCECAICSYVCPAYRPVTDLVMEGKAMLAARMKIHEALQTQE